MKALMYGGAVALALMVTGCGDTDGGNASAADLNAPVATIAAPNGGDWAETVSETSEGGYRVGNPDAPVKLIEFASLTCSHCGEFAKTGMPALTEKYIKTGQVSLELRNYVRDPIDMTAALLTRCGGVKPYFKLTEQMFDSQMQWMQPFQTMGEAEAKRLGAIPPEQQFGELAKAGGLVQFVKMRGIPEAKANACLADKAALDRLVSMRNAADAQYKITGTPSFVINGTVVENAADWRALEPKIREAIG